MKYLLNQKYSFNKTSFFKLAALILFLFVDKSNCMVQRTDPFTKYFKENEIMQLLGEVKVSSNFYLDECLEPGCDLRRNKQPECRKGFENVFLAFSKNTEFINQLSRTKTLRIVDFGSGYLFQTFVIVRKLIDKILQLPEFQNEKINLVVDVIDPGYLQLDQFKDSFDSFTKYFINQYQKHFQINFQLNVLIDGNSISDISFSDCALIFTCADFERFVSDKQNDIVINLPEELLAKFYNTMQVGNIFWFCTLNKFGFVDKNENHIRGPVVFLGEIEKTSNLSWEVYIKQKNVKVLPFFRRVYFAPFKPDVSKITEVPFDDNLDKL